MRKDICDNSLFHTNFANKSVLILVPHEDDEINLAGSFIRLLIKTNIEVNLVYTTNGDYHVKAERRYKEVLSSLKKLGVNSSNVYFLGYGDSYFDYDGTHIFYADQDPITTKSGKFETYGAMGIQEFAYQHRRKHSSFTRKNFLYDLRDLIKEVYADILVCTDFDQHPDHRMLSLSFDEAIGMILNEEGNQYQPIVIKGFAYSTAYTAVQDLFRLNIISTLKPKVGITYNYDINIIDSSLYEWSKRLRFPVVHECRRVSPILKNKLIQAMLCHKSQHIVTHSENIINGDAIFWERRTDSLTHKATVITSSGDGNKVKDFGLINTRNINERIAIFDNYLWSPQENDNEKKLFFFWNDPISLRYLKIFGNIDDGSQIIRFRVTMNDGFIEEYGPLPNKGTQFEVDLGMHFGILFLKIELLETVGNAPGIAEIELFNDDTHKLLPSFIKAIINDNFIYNYYMLPDEKSVKLSVYKYNVESNYNILIIKGKANIKGEEITPLSKVVILKVYIKGTDIYDIFSIEKLTKLNLFVENSKLKIGGFTIRIFSFRMYGERWFGYLREKGFQYVLNKLYQKVLKIFSFRRINNG